LACDGGSYSITDYPLLFAEIGYTFGGSGASFAVPDLRGRMPLGVSSGFALGATGGAQTETLSVNQIPSHDHTIPDTITTLHDIPVGAVPVLSPGPFSATTGNTGGSGSHNNMPPYLALVPAIVAEL
jgi:microcystin-dependent protein